jgi:two-component system OmpR family response regulator
MSTERKRILMVHEPGLVRLFKLVLERTGRYEFHGESDPTEAANAAADFKPDLFLLNIIMPKIDGVVLAEQLRNDPRFSKIPIIFLTGLVGSGQTKNIGGFLALGQPVTQVEMERALEAHLPRQPDESLLTTRTKISPYRSEPGRLLHCLKASPPNGPNDFRWETEHLAYNLTDDLGDSIDGKKVMVPTLTQWETFWRVCDEIDVWSWPPTLGDVHIVDSLSWELSLMAGGLRVESKGQVRGSPVGFEEKLMRLHRALQQMTGWTCSSTIC